MICMNFAVINSINTKYFIVNGYPKNTLVLNEK